MHRRSARLAAALLLVHLAALIAAPLPVGAQEPAGGPGPGERAALAELNMARLAAGLEPVRHAAALSRAAANHAAYIRLNPADAEQDAHREYPGRPGFTGVTVLDRAQAAGWDGHEAAEVVAYEPSALAAVRGWLATPYHRTPLLRPRVAWAGFGSDRTPELHIQSMALGLEPGAALPAPLVFPAPGQAAVPTGWHGRESPDPLRFFAGARGPLGYTVSVTFPGRVTALQLDEARLTGPAGDVPVYTLTPTADEHLTDTLALLPRAPLAGGTQYTAVVRGHVTYNGGGPRPVDLAWKFTTAPAPPDADRGLWWTDEGRAVEFALEGTGLGAGLKVFLGGLPVADLRAEGNRARFRPPAGLPPGPADLLAVTAGGELRWPGFLNGQLAVKPTGSAPQTWAVVQETAAGPRRLDVRALYHGGTDSPLLISAAALRALGGSVAAEEASRLYLLRLGNRWAVAGPDTAAVWYGVEGAPHLGQRALLPRPPLMWGGELYLPAAVLPLLGGAAGADPATRTAVIGTGVAFPDTLGHWARSSILDLAGRGIIHGYEDGTFRPDRTLTRAALTKLMAAAAGLKPVIGLPALFSDTQRHWVSLQGWLQAAAAGGLLSLDDYPGGRFMPEQEATRLEVAVMAVRALGREAEAQRRARERLDARYIDAGAVPAAYRGHIIVALEQGLLTGYAEAGGRYSLRPARTATRAEAAVIIARMLAKVGDARAS